MAGLNDMQDLACRHVDGHLDDIDLRLFEDCRHELCNELNKEDIYEEIYGWITDHMNS